MNKIALISPPTQEMFPHLACGGIQPYLEDFAEQCHDSKLNFCVIVPSSQYDKNDNYPFEICRTSSFNKKEDPRTTDEIYYQEVNDIIQNNGCDLIWAHEAPEFARYFTNTNAQVVLSCHSGIQKTCKIVPYDNVKYRFLSQKHHDMWVKDDSEAEASFWCYTGYIDKHIPIEPKTNEGDYALWVANLGWGSQNKGLNLFVNLARQHPDIQFKAYGSGNVNLEEELKNLKFNNFTYGGHLDRGPKHREVFQNARLFCQFSILQEAFARTSVESLCQSTPVLISNTSSSVTEAASMIYENDFVSNYERAPSLRGSALQHAIDHLKMSDEISNLLSFNNSQNVSLYNS